MVKAAITVFFFLVTLDRVFEMLLSAKLGFFMRYERPTTIFEEVIRQCKHRLLLGSRGRSYTVVDFKI